MAIKKRRRIKKGIIILFIIILVLALLVVGKKLLSNNNSSKKVEVSDSIEEYGYNLNDNETKYYKELFNKLKNELSESEINEEEYAKLVAQLFVADFFNLDNKENKNDIGGTQFIYTNFQSDFEKLAKESIYKTIENNMYSSRNQKLPVVTDTEIINIENISYEYLDNIDNDAYEVTIEIEYKEDLEYQDECTIIIVHSNNKLEIVKMI